MFMSDFAHIFPTLESHFLVWRHCNGGLASELGKCSFNFSILEFVYNYYDFFLKCLVQFTIETISILGLLW